MKRTGAPRVESRRPVGTIYLIHFDKPYKHARHYLGWAADLGKRLAAHRGESGTRTRGSRLVAVVGGAGIAWEVGADLGGDARHGTPHQGARAVGLLPEVPRETARPAAGRRLETIEGHWRRSMNQSQNTAALRSAVQRLRRHGDAQSRTAQKIIDAADTVARDIVERVRAAHPGEQSHLLPRGYAVVATRIPGGTRVWRLARLAGDRVKYIYSQEKVAAIDGGGSLGNTTLEGAHALAADVATGLLGDVDAVVATLVRDV